MKNKELDTIEYVIFKILWFVFLVMPWELMKALKEAMKPADKYKRDFKGRFSKGRPVKELKIRPRFKYIYNKEWQIVEVKEVK